MAIPTTSDIGTYSAANNTLFAYPIRLDGVYCWPDTLHHCSIDQSYYDSSSDKGSCCSSLYSKSSTPYEEVSDSMVVFLSIGLPIIFLTLRLFLWRCFLNDLLRNCKVVLRSDDSWRNHSATKQVSQYMQSSQSEYGTGEEPGSIYNSKDSRQSAVGDSELLNWPSSQSFRIFPVQSSNNRKYAQVNSHLLENQSIWKYCYSICCLYGDQDPISDELIRNGHDIEADNPSELEPVYDDKKKASQQTRFPCSGDYNVYYSSYHSAWLRYVCSCCRIQRHTYAATEYLDMPYTTIYRISNVFWLHIYWNSIISLILSFVLQLLIVGYLKEKVSAPRPIFYALNIFSTIHSDIRSYASSTSHRSFPSGHSSCIAACMGYFALVLMKDAVDFNSFNKLTNGSRNGPHVGHILISRMAILAAMGSLVLILWVGATRIRDYWHFANDVIGGWLIGAVIAVSVYVFMTSHTSKSMYSIYMSIYEEKLHSCR